MTFIIGRGGVMDFTGERHIPHMSDKLTEFEHLARYHAVKDIVKGQTVLDAACGEGYGSYLLSFYAAKVIGLDISEESIYHANNKYSTDNLSFYQGSIDKLPLPDASVDIVVSFETIEHVDGDTQRDFLNEAIRVLKKTGKLIISTPDKFFYSDERKYQNPFHIKEFYKQEFLDFLKGYFRYVELYYQRQEVSMVITNANRKIMNHMYTNDPQPKEDGMYLIAMCSQHPISEDNISFMSVSTHTTHNDEVINYFGFPDEIRSYKNEIEKIIAQSRFLQTDYLLQILKTIKSDRKIYLWGTGIAARNTYYALTKEGYNIEAFIDSNSAKWGGTFLNRQVVPPESINGYEQKHFIVIASSYFSEIIPNLERMGYIKGIDYTLGLVM
ncbi:class I SAM-dependent methyltransferase [Paenibacillus forsythiae]|nr:class I SAM-dependent methyltransferase [Paenibacillus forsythiae]